MYCDTHLCPNATTRSSDCFEECVDPWHTHPTVIDESVELNRVFYSCMAEHGCEGWPDEKTGDFPCGDALCVVLLAPRRRRGSTRR